MTSANPDTFPPPAAPQPAMQQGNVRYGGTGATRWTILPDVRNVQTAPSAADDLVWLKPPPGSRSVSFLVLPPAAGVTDYTRVLYRRVLAGTAPNATPELVTKTVVDTASVSSFTEEDVITFEHGGDYVALAITVITAGGLPLVGDPIKVVYRWTQ